MGCYTSSRNRVRGLSLPICEVAESRIFSLFWSCLFWNGHSEFARPSRTHFPTIWDYSVEFLGCELFPLSQTKTHPCRFTVNSFHEKADPCQELVLFFPVRVFALSMIFSISVPFSQAASV